MKGQGELTPTVDHGKNLGFGFWGSIHLGPHEKGKSGSKQDETQFITKKIGAFLSLL
jgi:hypothetical protein